MPAGWACYQHPLLLTDKLYTCPQYTADDFSFADAPRPFKNPHFQRNAATGKRTKTLKQVLALEKERVDGVLEASKAAGAVGSVSREVVSGESALRSFQWRMWRGSSRCIALADYWEKLTPFPLLAASTVEAPPSLMPQKRYCDVTGLEVRCVRRMGPDRAVHSFSCVGSIR